MHKQMYKIGFEAKRLFTNFTGLGNYSRNLVEGISNCFPENKYFLFTPKTKKNVDTQDFFENKYNIVKPTKGNKNIWRSYKCRKEIQDLNIDLFHGLSHEIPFGLKKLGIKTVVTIHDLIYKTYPKDFKLIDRKIYDYKFKYACNNSDKIIAVSQSTKNDLQKLYNIPEQKIEVVYQSCMLQYKNINSELEKKTIKEKYELPDKFLLYVGSIIKRKNLLGIVKAIRKIDSKERLPLVVIGNGKKYKNEVLKYIEKHNLKDYVLFTKGISFQDLPLVYQLAEIFIYPSFYEGFGIPIIEALWSKTPVITSNISSLPEAAGDGAFYCDPNRPKTITEGIQKILTNPEYKNKLLEHGYNHVQKFNSEVNANKLMEVYKSVLNGN